MKSVWFTFLFYICLSVYIIHILPIYTYSYLSLHPLSICYLSSYFNVIVSQYMPNLEKKDIIGWQF